MKHFQSVLAFGDSHVAGNELSTEWQSLTQKYVAKQITIEELDEYGKQLAFPKIVADKLGVPCFNYAMSGGSNDRSLRLLIQEIVSHPHSLVLFGYTSTTRKEFYFPDNGFYPGRDKDNFIQLGPQWVHAKLNHVVNDKYLSIMRPYNNLKQLMFIVDQVCKSFAADFYHIPLFQEELPNVSNRITFEGHNDYLNWCDEKKFKVVYTQHYGQDAHDALAELILQDLYFKFNF